MTTRTNDEDQKSKRRRDYGTGGITERKDKDGITIGYQVQLLLPGGKRKTLGTVKTRRAATKLARQGQADLAAGRLFASSRQTVGEYLTSWLEAKRPAIRYKTYVTYRTVIAHATRLIGHVRLEHLRPAHIEQAEAELGKTKGARTVQMLHTVLHNAFGRAVQLDLIHRNPTEPVIPPSARRQERPVLSLSQARALFETTRDDRLHALYVVLATTGVRLGEALGLAWEDVDLEHRTMSLHRAQQRQTGKGFVLDELKTAKSRRVVPLMAIAVDALRRHRVRQSEQRLMLGPDWIESSRVFTSVIGTPLDPADVRRTYYPSLARAGLPRVRLHDLRHTAATLMASEGVPTHLIQAVLGHTHVATTLDIYTHVLQASLREVGERMDAAFARADAVS